jgi:hypothetical protein
VKHIVYVIEIEVCGNPLKYELLTASDESGSTRPLVWARREDAEAYADNLSREAAHHDCALEYLVVPLTGETTTMTVLPGSAVFPAAAVRADANQCPNC